MNRSRWVCVLGIRENSINTRDPRKAFEELGAHHQHDLFSEMGSRNRTLDQKTSVPENSHGFRAWTRPRAGPYGEAVNALIAANPIRLLPR